MLKKISMRWRLTLLTSLLIAVCCIGLSIVLSVSAYRMADSIEAAPMLPSYSENDVIDNKDVTGNFVPSVPSESTETVQQARHGYLSESLIYTLIAVLAGGLLTYYVSGKALEPLKALNEQVKNINAHNLSQSLDVPTTKDEIAELTASFNNITDKLDEAFSMQKRFSADAAHELRTPLAVLQTKLDVFRKKAEHTPEEYETLTAAFQKQISRLRNLVTELLAIANMEDDLEKQDIPLKQLLEEVLKELSPIAEKKNVALTLLCNEINIIGDKGLLYRAFYNLIENAIKYNIPDGNVTVKVTVNKDNTIIVTIEDTGIGIPDSLKKQIFEPFYRVDKSRSREMGGAGLGLSLVDSIVKKHGGIITVSDRDGGGSCFTVTIPKIK